MKCGFGEALAVVFIYVDCEEDDRKRARSLQPPSGEILTGA